MNKLAKLNKGLLIPILALLALIIKQYFNVTISETSLNEIADVLLGGISAVGFFMHPKSKAAQQEVEKAVEIVAEDVVQNKPVEIPAGEKQAIPPK